MITDLAEISRLGAARGAENLEFRRYLAEHHHRVEELQAIAAGLQPHFDCTTCANCCRHSIVDVSPKEVETIAAYLRLDTHHVVRHFTAVESDGRILCRNHSGCTFLRDSLCAIYPARPHACRTFPHLALGTHSLGARLSSICRWAAICPIVYNAIEIYKQRTGWRHLAATSRG